MNKQRKYHNYFVSKSSENNSIKKSKLEDKKVIPVNGKFTWQFRQVQDVPESLLVNSGRGLGEDLKPLIRSINASANKWSSLINIPTVFDPLIKNPNFVIDFSGTEWVEPYPHTFRGPFGVLAHCYQQTALEPIRGHIRFSITEDWLFSTLWQPEDKLSFSTVCTHLFGSAFGIPYMEYENNVMQSHYFGHFPTLGKQETEIFRSMYQKEAIKNDKGAIPKIWNKVKDWWSKLDR